MWRLARATRAGGGPARGAPLVGGRPGGMGGAPSAGVAAVAAPLMVAILWLMLRPSSESVTVVPAGTFDARVSIRFAPFLTTPPETVGSGRPLAWLIAVIGDEPSFVVTV